MKTTKHTEQRLKLERTYARQHLAALTEYNGMHHLMDLGLNPDNCRFEPSSLTFELGVNAPYRPDEVAGLQTLLTYFPFAFEIKTRVYSRVQS